jgi:type IV pilus assembly protein PilF
VKNPLYRHPDDALTNAGWCMLRQGNKNKAEEYFRKALRSNPRNRYALLEMAALAYQSGRALPARGYLQRFSEVSAPTPNSLWLGVQVERALGNTETAASYAMLLESKFPDSEEAQRLQGIVQE